MKEIELPQGRIRYSEYGTGDPIVLIHGVLVDGQLWRKIVPLLETDHRVIVPELPLGAHTIPMPEGADTTPHGVAGLVADFLDALDLEDVTLVGNDTGGAICQMVVTEHPERIGRLVLTPCDSFEDFPPPMFKPLVMAAKVPGALKLIGQSLRIKRLRRTPIAFGLLTKRPIPDDVVDSWLAPAAIPGITRDVKKTLGGFDKRYTLAAADKLPQFHKPALLPWPREDRVFPFRNAERLADLLPHARIVEIEDSYTFVSEDQPEQLARAIREFVREPAASPA